VERPRTARRREQDEIAITLLAGTSGRTCEDRRARGARAAPGALTTAATLIGSIPLALIDPHIAPYLWLQACWPLASRAMRARDQTS
jgi:hypothetical protein